MGRIIDKTWVRIVLAVVAMHALLLPVLYVGIARVVERSSEETFANQVRANARIIADQLERLSAPDFPQAALTILDGAILSGRCLFADLTVETVTYRSPLSTSLANPPQEDFAFGAHGDDMYFVNVPIDRGGRPAVMRLGFDESPTAMEIAAARRQLLYVLAIYATVSLALAFLLGWTLVKPLHELQIAAARIGSGDQNQALMTASRLQEMQQLSGQLESMRLELVGANERLRLEAREREATELERNELAARLAEKKRLETIGTLAGGIAHEFNNVMTPILLYAQDARESLAQESPLREDIEQIVRSAQRARRLTRDVLTFSRGTELGRNVRFDVTPVVAEVGSFLGRLVPPSINIVVQGDQRDLYVDGDPDMVHQLLVNLCVNGYQAMREHGGELTLSATQASVDNHDRVPAGDYVVLAVRDQGQGIEAELLERIFEPFFTTRDVGEGSGLGLSVVHGVAKSLGATVTVDSKLGHGSEFRVYIPVAAGAVRDATSA